ncbi:MAG: uncharacterized protein JWM40_645 [Frankiales bacterium]|nr:uncharacterized protein [Frankiales bacterium]
MPLIEESSVSSVPPPVAAALALLEGARRLPPKLPALAVSTALNAAIVAKTHYDELAERGEKIVAGWRGTSFDEIEDKVEDRLQGTGLATPYDKVEDAIEDATAKVADLLDKAASRGKKAPAPTGPVDTAATPDVVETVQAVVDAADTSVVIAHDDLPLPDYDHMTLGSLRGRLRSLSVEELVQVRDYEKAHAHRLPVVTLLDNRIAKLATDASAEPSPGGEPPVLPTADKAKKATAPKKASGPKKAAKPKPKVRTT